MRSVTSEAPGLHLDARLAARGVDVSIDVAANERVAVLGANGSGKSTLLSILAGILRPDSGRCTLGGETLFDLGKGRPVWSPPHARGISLLAQDALLFPHMSVLDNVAFGPRSQGRSMATARASAMGWLTRVEADQFADRRPSQLSGGQAQRVAIARALAAEPRLLLLDEPMAALDITMAPLLRRLLRRVLSGRPTMIVTHDLLDALLLSERVIVLSGGKVVETGPTQEVLTHPRDRFTARIAGLNLLHGTAHDKRLVQTGGQTIEGTPVAVFTDGDDVAAVFAPSAIAVHLDDPHGSPRNAIPVTVTEIEPRDDKVRVRATDRSGHTLTADVTLGAIADLDLYPGRDVVFVVKATTVTLYPV